MKSTGDHIQNFRFYAPDSSTSLELTRLVFLDIETTGLRPDRGAKITEVSILNRNSQLYYWRPRTDTENDSVAKDLPNILNYLKQGVVVGHNLQFDFWFIAYESDRLEIEGPSLRFIDTLSLSRKLLPKRYSHTLGELLTHFDIKVHGQLHTATTDTFATRALFWKLVEKGGLSNVGEAGMKKLNWASF